MVRLLEAFLFVNIAAERLGDSEDVVEAIEGLDGNKKIFIIREMCHYAEGFGRTSRKLAQQLIAIDRPQSGELRAMVDFVVRHLFSNPRYYLWSCPQGQFRGKNLRKLRK